MTVRRDRMIALLCLMVPLAGCGSVEAYIDMNKGCIRGISFRGDFFAAEDPAALADLLLGCPLEETALTAQLQNHDISRYFMGLDTAQFIRLLTG